jgi:drug/metabolite transporter (DMT)-like permease
MKIKKFIGPLILLITSVVWGLCFVAQTAGMDHVGPFTFHSTRSLLGAAVLVPVILIMDAVKKKKETYEKPTRESRKKLLVAGVLCGIALCVASCFQQYGIYLGTGAGKGGFITAFYVILVPIASIFIGRKSDLKTWLCVPIALAGLYLLCIGDTFKFEGGDLYVLASAFFYTAQILLIDKLAPSLDGVRLAALQFLFGGILAGIPALIFENPSWSLIVSAGASILYAGVMSCGVAYTLQIIGQKYTHPTVASIIMSSEALFALISGMIILQDFPSIKESFGCVLMLTAIIVAVVPSRKKE